MDFIHILARFIPQYKWRIIIYIVLNIICSICSVFSFAAIVPLLNILFGISDESIEKLSSDNISTWSDFLNYEKNNSTVFDFDFVPFAYFFCYCLPK